MSKKMNIRDVLKSEMMRPLAVLQDKDGTFIELDWYGFLAIAREEAQCSLELVECNAIPILKSLLGYIAEMSMDDLSNTDIGGSPALQMPVSAASRGDIYAMLWSASAAKNRCLQLGIDDEKLYLDLDHILARGQSTIGVRHPALKQDAPEEQPLCPEDPLAVHKIQTPDRQKCQIPIPHGSFEL